MEDDSDAPQFARSSRCAAGRFAEHCSQCVAGSHHRCGEIRAREGQGKAKSVIFLWMAGGVTHIDSFDPKPEAPVEVRGMLGDIATKLPGVRFCETVPELASVADKLAVLRSFSHDSSDHLISQVYTLSGRRVTMSELYSEPNIGSLVWRLQGPRNGLPGYIAVPGITRPGPPPYNLFVGGWLGNQYAPYCLGGLPEQPDFTVGEKLDNPPAEASEDLQPAVARPRARSAAGPAFEPAATARFVRPGPPGARPERNGRRGRVAVSKRPAAA